MPQYPGDGYSLRPKLRDLRFRQASQRSGPWYRQRNFHTQTRYNPFSESLDFGQNEHLVSVRHCSCGGTFSKFSRTLPSSCTSHGQTNPSQLPRWTNISTTNAIFKTPILGPRIIVASHEPMCRMTIFLLGFISH